MEKGIRGVLKENEVVAFVLQGVFVLRGATGNTWCTLLKIWLIGVAGWYCQLP